MSSASTRISGDSGNGGEGGSSNTNFGTTTNGAVIAPTPLKNSHSPSLAGSVIEASDGGIIGDGTNKLLIRIQNIASTANFGVRLDLKKIALICAQKTLPSSMKWFLQRSVSTMSQFLG